MVVSLTVDLDPVGAYHQIHGLSPADPGLRHHFSRLALPRFLELFERLGVRATFFAVGDDLASEDVGALLREAVSRGHEVANHTATHPYDLLDLDLASQAAEIDRAHARIAQVTGREPVGFRTPGYQINARLLNLLLERGYLYDASMLPSFPYYGLKLAAMALMRLRNRRSRSRVHAPWLLLAPEGPYRPDPQLPWRRGRSPLVEIPAATQVLGVPLVGTFLAGLPKATVRPLARHLARRSFVTVEFHAIDLVDLAPCGLRALAEVQPAGNIPLSRRLSIFQTFLDGLCSGGGGSQTLAQVAQGIV